jgi:hypothetical protein
MIRRSFTLIAPAITDEAFVAKMQVEAGSRPEKLRRSNSTPQAVESMAASFHPRRSDNPEWPTGHNACSQGWNSIAEGFLPRQKLQRGGTSVRGSQGANL